MDDLSHLMPAEYNPRSISDQDFKALVESVGSFGDMSGLVFNKRTERIVGGHQRRDAYLKKGGKIEITETLAEPNEVGTIARGYVVIGTEKFVYRVVDWPESKEKLANLATNKIQGDWDDKALAALISSISDDVDISKSGFNEQEITDILNGIAEVGEKDVDLKVPEEPKTKIGDVYELGNHRIICGDAQDPEVYKKVMAGSKAKLIFTSPPYNMDGGMYKDHYSDDKESEEYIEFNLKVVKNCIDFLSGFLCWNISYNKNARSEFIEIIYKIINDIKLRFLELVVWDKGHAMPITSNEMLTRQYEDVLIAGTEDVAEHELELYVIAKHGRRGWFNKKTSQKLTNYWRIGTANTQTEEHKAAFPVELPARAIKLMTLKNDLVLDPFLGTGTTLIAAEQMGRFCVGIEADPGYCDVAVRRWETITGKKAVLAK